MEPNQPRDPVKDTRVNAGFYAVVPSNEIQLDMYDPPMQTRSAATSLVVRMKRGEERNRLAVAAAIQTQATQLDPRVLVSGITTLEDIVHKELAP